MKRFDGSKDYWELRGIEYEYTGPEWADEGYWIREEFKEALLNETKRGRGKEVLIQAACVAGVIGVGGILFYLFFSKMIKFLGLG